MDYLRKRGSAATRMAFLGACTVASVSCGDDPVSHQAGPGTIMVTTTTVGNDFDPNGYTVAVNDGQPRAIDNLGTLFFNDLEAGAYDVSLSGMTANCSTVQGENPRTVVVIPLDTVSAGFQITCVVPGGGGGPSNVVGRDRAGPGS